MKNKLKQLMGRYLNIKTLVAFIVSTAAIVVGNTIYKNPTIIISRIGTITNFLILKVEMPIWSVISALMVVVFCFSRYLFSYSQGKSLLKYKEDEIDSIIWRWDYTLSLENKYVINNLRSHCPLCKCELSLDRHKYYYCANQECTNSRDMGIYKIDNNNIVKVIKKRIEEKFPHKIDKIE